MATSENDKKNNRNNARKDERLFERAGRRNSKMATLSYQQLMRYSHVGAYPHRSKIDYRDGH